MNVSFKLGERPQSPSGPLDWVFSCPREPKKSEPQSSLTVLPGTLRYRGQRAAIVGWRTLSSPCARGRLLTVHAREMLRPWLLSRFSTDLPRYCPADQSGVS